MKKFFTSFYFTIPVFVLGVVFVSQATNPQFIASADVNTISNNGMQIFLFVLGLICLILAGILIFVRFLTRKG
ncbi:hypothetical protein COT77_00740 [Candidatus Berkelbacteria bacterium CG10_big_fil_rev_8_21_14_0_10_41_12]|uniref:Uncharacterized protein n=1 Tax=Candidatus Berkelbacteria bacterium CG10_big_fil_rev_8_21_14_0_10_41_12 TaxID=1974513 RepID=A0A2M6WXM5_9BACT|nr:MAG: hypothetical protein COT77_00740 [Candidatus Berkelbacteria bacterium CG10_big_fil_rev_8_21_14_0_10_41_12]